MEPLAHFKKVKQLKRCARWIDAEMLGMAPHSRTSMFVLMRPGITSRLNRNAGTQNEWMTSGEVSEKRIVVSVGRTSCGG